MSGPLQQSSRRSPCCVGKRQPEVGGVSWLILELTSAFHTKRLIQKKNGLPVNVLTGYANFAVRGLYIQANNVIVFDDLDERRTSSFLGFTPLVVPH